MSFQYTKATLKTHLSSWVEGNGTSADAEFVAALDEIISRGELRLLRDLDLCALDSVATTNTAIGTQTLTKPATLIADRALFIDISSLPRAIIKRSRQFMEMLGGQTGTPRYYGELSETTWRLAPTPDAVLTVRVHGIYRPTSLAEGVDGGTTWLSTRFPDLLAHACDIEAAEFLKFWARKAAAEVAYGSKLDDARGQTTNLRRTDIEDMISWAGTMQAPTVAPEPAAT